MKRLKARYGCPVELSLDMVGGKWNSVLLARLKDKPLRYGELRSLVPGMSEKMLTQRLKDLERSGLVKKETEGRPVYVLTTRAQSLRPVLEGLYRWGRAMAAEQGIELPQTAPSVRAPRTLDA